MIAQDHNGAATGDRMLDSALRKSGSLIGAAQAFAIALDQLGAIDVPPVMHGQIDQAQLKAIASLYLASDLEAAGVIPAVEQLSGLSRGAGVTIDVGGAAPLVADFWHHRNDRATAEERGQCFARLFGGAFEDLMLDLCEALYKLDELATNADYGGIAQQTRVRSTATRLLEAMAEAGGGNTVFLAQEIMESLKAALAILGHAGLRGAFGARDVWGAIAGIDRLTKTPRVDPRLYVRRGRAGMTVLSWLADTAPHVDNLAILLVALDHPVIPVAVDWMEAALAIGEASGDLPPTSMTPPATPYTARAVQAR
ncbi:MAG: hypothetical protein ABI624_02045 [Casimicrobiaceae bacterium]